MFPPSVRRAVGALALSFAVMGAGGCNPAKAPDASIKVAEHAVKWTPDLVSAAAKTARSARKANDPGPPPAPPPPHPGGNPHTCSYAGPAPDGRPVFVCGGYPWIQDARTGVWVVYTPEQAGQRYPPAPPR
jgi:hypothetical protein